MGTMRRMQVSISIFLLDTEVSALSAPSVSMEFKHNARLEPNVGNREPQ